MIIIETRQGIHFLGVLMINHLKVYFQSKVIGNVSSSCPNHFSENFISFKLSRFCNLIRDFSSNFFLYIGVFHILPWLCAGSMKKIFCDYFMEQMKISCSQMKGLGD